MGLKNGRGQFTSMSQAIVKKTSTSDSVNKMSLFK